MEISRNHKREAWAFEKIKAWLTRRPRSKEGWHVSDLLYPRKALYQRLKPLPITDEQALYFVTGHGHHGVVEAMLKRDESKQPWGVLTFAAALMESGGTFLSSPSAVSITGQKKSLIDWLALKFKGTVKANEWKLTGAEAEKFVRAVHPFMLAKRAQAESWLKIIDEGKGTLAKEDSKLVEWAAKRTDEGEFKKHGILFSPDLRLPYPLEFKTSRMRRMPEGDMADLKKSYESYLKQLCSYMALMDNRKGALLVLFLAVQSAVKKWQFKPALRFYSVRMKPAERKAKVAELIALAKKLTGALKKKSPTGLPLCAEWLCKTCPYFKPCKPWLVEPKRKTIQDK